MTINVEIKNYPSTSKFVITGMIATDGIKTTITASGETKEAAVDDYREKVYVLMEKLKDEHNRLDEV